MVADHLFQAAFGGSFLNHQWLISAASPQWDTSQSAVPAGKNSVLDSAGFPNAGYPLYAPLMPAASTSTVRSPRPAACRAPWPASPAATTPSTRCSRRGRRAPGGANILPGINDVDPTKPFYQTNIGDEMTAKGISWSWYAGGWNAAVAAGSRTRCSSTTTSRSTTSRIRAGHARTGPPEGRDRLLRSREEGESPDVSFVKPIGEENEHPGYASAHTGSNHLVELIKSILKGPTARTR